MFTGIAIQSAKAFKYAYEGQDAAREWGTFILDALAPGNVGLAALAGCPPTPDLMSIMKSFIPFADARPDLPANFDTIPGGPGCGGKGKKGDKKKCNDDESQDDGNNDNNDNNDNNGNSSKSEEPKTTAAPSSANPSSTASTSTISDKKCTFYKKKVGNQRVMMKREYSDFIKTVGDGRETITRMVNVARETGI